MDQLQLFPTPEPPASVVYLAMRGGVAKIGMSTNPRNRMRQLGCDLVGVIPGGREVEAQLHREFARFRVRDEWFMPDVSILRRFGAAA